jgi:tRNA 5-methylaminomethyl-2-thiouridine biosynthesis bifunctional protein
LKIEPAPLAFDGNGTPFSNAYGDVYHSAESATGQAAHVFLGGNDLPGRWAGRRTFVIVEAGFGLGLNFLTTWRAWRGDGARCDRLHYVAVEKHPFDRDALAEAHARYADFAPMATQLHEAWPPLVAGLHRLHFDEGRVTLTVGFGDVADIVPKLRLTADAIYLDGFAPRCNPDMWSERLMKGLSRLARAGTTVATYSSAGAVREGLEAAGFAVDKAPGFGRKRDMLRGSFAPRWPLRDPPSRASASRHAIVVGAGLAGAAVTHRLAARGWQIDLIDARDTSPRFAGAFHPHVSPDDAIRSRALRNGFLYAVRNWLGLQDLAWSQCGAFQLTDSWDAAQVAALGYPAEYARFVEREEARALCGAAVATGGWWFAGGGWMRLSSLASAQIAASGVRRIGKTVHAIANDSVWRALDADGGVIATAPILILANASDAMRLARVGRELNRMRGQVTFVPASSVEAPRSVVLRSGYVLPAVEGMVTVGSTYDADDDPQPQRASHEANLARLQRLLPGAMHSVDRSALGGEVGFRSVVPDRMPLVGAMPDIDEARRQQSQLKGAHLTDLPRREGLYCVTGLGSRGLAWSTLAGEMIGSLLEHEPLPVEGDLADALDPARFVLKRVRLGNL